jgi:Electron transfer DM13
MRVHISAPVGGMALLAAGCLLSPLTLYAQNDSAMMKHDTTMTMGHDSAMMGHDSGMAGMKDEHMMGKDGMAPNMMFMSAESHKAAGDYEIVENKGKQQIKLTPDFSVDQAPDTYLVLATSDQPDDHSVYLGKVRNPKGSQTFDVPKGTDLSKFSKLLVWSKKTGTLLGSADLAASGHMMEK